MDWTQNEFCIDDEEDVSYHRPVSPNIVVKLQNKIKEQERTIKDLRSFMNDFIKYHREGEKKHREVNRLINELDMKIPVMFSNHLLNKE